MQKFKNSCGRVFLYKNVVNIAPDIVKLAFNHIITYPTPLNLNYL